MQSGNRYAHELRPMVEIVMSSYDLLAVVFDDFTDLFLENPFRLFG